MSREAADDLSHINKYKDEIKRAANKYGMKASVVAAIISRETRGGRGAGLDSNGFGDHGNAYGLMQIDKRWHTLKVNPKTGALYAWDSQEHIEQGTGILVGCFSDVKRKFPQFAGDQELRGALAAYNMGTERMDPNNVDAHTTGGNYSSDVIARAQYYEKHGY